MNIFSWLRVVCVHSWVVKGGLCTFSGWLRVVCVHFWVVKGGLCAFVGG